MRDGLTTHKPRANTTRLDWVGPWRDYKLSLGRDDAMILPGSVSDTSFCKWWQPLKVWREWKFASGMCETAVKRERQH